MPPQADPNYGRYGETCYKAIYRYACGRHYTEDTSITRAADCWKCGQQQSDNRRQDRRLCNPAVVEVPVLGLCPVCSAIQQQRAVEDADMMDVEWEIPRVEVEPPDQMQFLWGFEHVHNDAQGQRWCLCSENKSDHDSTERDNDRQENGNQESSRRNRDGNSQRNHNNNRRGDHDNNRRGDQNNNRGGASNNNPHRSDSGIQKHGKKTHKHSQNSHARNSGGGSGHRNKNNRKGNHHRR